MKRVNGAAAGGAGRVNVHKRKHGRSAPPSTDAIVTDCDPA